jgi:acyl carrier protein
VVVASNDAGSAATLVAYVIPSGARGIDRADVRAHLKRLLPEYMIPSLLVVLERLPLTPNGKVDRNALPKPSRSSLADGRGPTAPRDDLERRLAAVWAQVLALDEVGIHDNFFELGGHSLRATRAVYELQLALGIHVELIDIFKAPTVAALAARLRTRLATPDRVTGPNRPFRGLASPAEHAIAPITAEERDLLEDL